MVSIVAENSIKKTNIYECIADFTDPLDKEVSFKKGDIVFGKDILKLDETIIQFFKLIGGKNITHKIVKDKITKINRRNVEVGDVFFVKFARTKYKLVTVLDVLEDCQMAAVYPTSIGYLPLGPLCREEHKGWIGVNYDFVFDIPTKTVVISNEDMLGD